MTHIGHFSSASVSAFSGGAVEEHFRGLATIRHNLSTLIEQATAWTGKEIKQRTEAMAEEAYNTVWKP